MEKAERFSVDSPPWILDANIIGAMLWSGSLQEAERASQRNTDDSLSAHGN
jgi:hypothetical protein